MLSKIPLFCFVIFSALSLNALVDLEEFKSDFVIETKQILLPDYPFAFNPSIVPWKDHYLMSFRVLATPACLIKQSSEATGHYGSYIGVVELDQAFNPISSPQIISLNMSPHPKAISRASDARLVQVGEQLLIVYSDSTSQFLNQHCRMHVAELINEEGIFIAQNEICLSRFELERPAKQEKNWVPFDYQKQLFMAYRLSPHRIFKPNLDTGECDLYCLTKNYIQWDWGELRGGTPAIALEKSYLAFFHSSTKMATVHSQGRQVLHYFMGAYLFDLNPPFKIRQMSSQPIIGKNFYHGETYTPYWKPVVAVFPCGLVVDKDYIWVAYGRQDHELWIMKIDKEGLLKSLIPISEKLTGPL